MLCSGPRNSPQSQCFTLASTLFSGRLKALKSTTKSAHPVVPPPSNHVRWNSLVWLERREGAFVIDPPDSSHRRGIDVLLCDRLTLVSVRSRSEERRVGGEGASLE